MKKPPSSATGKSSDDRWSHSGSRKRRRSRSRSRSSSSEDEVSREKRRKHKKFHAKSLYTFVSPSEANKWEIGLDRAQSFNQHAIEGVSKLGLKQKVIDPNPCPEDVLPVPLLDVSIKSWLASKDILMSKDKARQVEQRNLRVRTPEPRLEVVRLGGAGGFLPPIRYMPWPVFPFSDRTTATFPVKSLFWLHQGKTAPGGRLCQGAPG